MIGRAFVKGRWTLGNLNYLTRGGGGGGGWGDGGGGGGGGARVAKEGQFFCRERKEIKTLISASLGVGRSYARENWNVKFELGDFFAPETAQLLAYRMRKNTILEKGSGSGRDVFGARTRYIECPMAYLVI